MAVKAKINGDIVIKDGNTDLRSLKELNTQVNTNTNNINNLMKYSSTETKIGTWINNKPIYRKVISKTVSSFEAVDISLGTSNIDLFINGRVLIDTSTWTSVDYTHINTNYYMGKWIFNKSTNVVRVYNNLSGGITGTIYVIVEYTKK